MYSTTAKYITLDTDALASLTKTPISQFRLDKETNWYKNFKISNTAKKCFDFQIKTDGVGCSVLLKKVTMLPIPPEKSESDPDNDLIDCMDWKTRRELQDRNALL